MIQSRVAGIGSIALGAGIAVSAILGPLVLKVITFRTSATIEDQFVGGEIVSLAIVAPVAIAAGVLWLRGHRLAAPLTLGPAAYAMYTYTTAILGQEYARYDGNVETFFPLYAGLVAGGAALAVAAWSRLGNISMPAPSDRLRRTLATIFIGLGGFFALAWTQQIRLVYTGNAPADYQAGPTLFWLIMLLDFGFLIPLLVSTGAGLLRKQPVAIKAAYGLAPFATCLAASVAGMGIVMLAKGDPSADPTMLVVMLAATTGLALVTAHLFRSCVQGTGATSSRTVNHPPAWRINPAQHANQP